jgi:hypothetical protein
MPGSKLIISDIYLAGIEKKIRTFVVNSIICPKAENIKPRKTLI